jgi:hypothetical protein
MNEILYNLISLFIIIKLKLYSTLRFIFKDTNYNIKLAQKRKKVFTFFGVSLVVVRLNPKNSNLFVENSKTLYI